MIRLARRRIYPLRAIAQMGNAEWTASFPLVAKLFRDLLRQFLGFGTVPKGRE